MLNKIAGALQGRPREVNGGQNQSILAYRVKENNYRNKWSWLVKGGQWWPRGVKHGQDYKRLDVAT